MPPEPRHELLDAKTPRSETPGIASAEAFVDALLARAIQHEATDHRCLARFGRGGYGQRSIEFARSYGRWYQGYSAWFPHYLRAVIERLESPEHRRLLASNLAEEQGRLDEDDRAALVALGIDAAAVDGVPHPELFGRFCRALGLQSADLDVPPVPTIEWRSALRASLRAGSGAYAVGALGLGTEAVVSTIYQPIVQGLKRLPELQKQDIVFFELHCHVDDQHYEDLRTIAIDLAGTRVGRLELERGMHDALELRLQFWTAFERHVATSPLIVDAPQGVKGA
ncbi:MAG: pyrroloquinoline quinone (PQQ) biosynthesis protein C [Planctomycetota bacterium]|jgi:pyrroloquinoline quinone (PQQ) biosynthesis protein C